MVTRDEALYLEVVTRKQSASLEWFALRVGRITASIAYEVLHTNQDKPSGSLLERLCSSEHKKINTAPLERGGQMKILHDLITAGNRKKDTQGFRAQLQGWLSTQSIHT